MKVTIRRTGGFAGFDDSRDIDTAHIDSTAANDIESIVKSIGFFDLPAFVSSDTIGADLLHYEVTIIDDDRRHTVAFNYDDSNKSAPLNKLVDILKKY